MKKYLIIYEIEIDEEDIDRVVELAEHLLSDPEEMNIKLRLKEIKGEDEEWKRFYDLNDQAENISSFKSKRK